MMAEKIERPKSKAAKPGKKPAAAGKKPEAADDFVHLHLQQIARTVAREVEQRRVEEHSRAAREVGDPPREGAVREEGSLAARGPRSAARRSPTSRRIEAARTCAS